MRLLVLGMLCVASITHAAHREFQMGDTVVFGLDPAWSAGSEFDKAFDGDANTFYDYAYSGHESYVGFDGGNASIPVEIRFTARKGYSERMVGGEFQGSNQSATTGFETIHTVNSDPGESEQVVSVGTGEAYRYYRYLAPTGSYGNIAEFSMVAEEVSGAEPLPQAPEGFRSAEVNGQTVFGLDPAWRSGREFENAFDGNSGTFYDYKYGDRESFIGFDYGQAAIPVRIHFTPRDKYTNRMIGGRFQGSNESPYSGYETLYEITSKPGETAQVVELNTNGTYRYFRYLAPDGSYGNIADFSMDLELPVTDEPTEPEEPPEAEEPPVVEEPEEPTPTPEPVVFPEGYRESMVAGTLVFGLDPAWIGGREFEMAFDGDGNTFYDFKHGDRETFIGFDAVEAIVPEQIIFQARAKYAGRMIGGRFEGSNQSPVSGYETLYTVNDNPSESEQSVPLETDQAYRYFRYVAPLGSYGNIAKFAVSGNAPAVEEPVVEKPTPEPTPAPEPTPEPDPEFVSGAELNFTLEAAGQTSAAVYDESNRLVRTLLTGAELEAGDHTLIWDGLDRDGDPVPAGDFTLKVLQAEGLCAEYITSLGINPGTTAYDTWLGTDGGVTAVAADASGLYLVAQNSETAPTILKQSLDGTQRLWTHDEDVVRGAWQGGISLASDGSNRVYLLQQNAYLQVLDSATGRVVSSWDVLPSHIERTEFIYFHRIGDMAKADLAASAGAIVLSLYDENRVSWLNSNNGSILSSVSVPHPLGVTVSPAGTVYVISEGKVLSVQSGGEVKAVVTAGLKQPARIDYDRTNDTLLVSDGFEGSQIKRFDLGGNRVATYGKSGGRDFGTYVNTDFYGVTDVTTDGAGGFVVAEPRTPPRRVAHFDLKGAVVNEWFGGQDYYAYAVPDPRDPTRVWFFTGDGLVLASLDLELKEWSVLETWVPDYLAGGLINRFYGFAGHWEIVYSGNRRYLVGQGSPQVLRHSDGDLKAVSISSKDARQLDLVEDIMGEPRPGWARSFVWSDADGDGLPQRAEIYYSGALSQVPHVGKVNDDFSLVSHTRSETGLTIHKIKPEWGPHGPHYPVSDFENRLIDVASVDLGGRPESRGTGSYADSDGNVYGFYNMAPERHGVFWPTDWASHSRFVKFDADGNQLWSVGRHAYEGGLAGQYDTAYVPSPSGQFHVLAKVIGELDNNAVILSDRVENLSMIWTEDGLYAGTIFDRRADDGLPESVYTWFLTEEGEAAITTTDNASGGKFIQYPDGTALWFVQGRNSVPVYKVTGWEDWSRQEYRFSTTSESPVAAGEGSGLIAQYFAGPIIDSPDATRIETQVWHGLEHGHSERHDVVDGRWGAIYNWTRGSDVLGQQSDFSVRWVGEIEAPLTEEFIFSIYARGFARLWVDGKPVISSWNGVTPRSNSEPIQLKAGQRYAVQLEYAANASHPAISLNWESDSLDRTRVPEKYLYPTPPSQVHRVGRSAFEPINGASFELESGDMQDWLTGVYHVSGQRQLGFGKSGAYLGYQNIDFGAGADQLNFTAMGRDAGGVLHPVTLSFRLDSPTGPTIANVVLTDALEDHVANIPEVSGMHDIYVVNTTAQEAHFIDFWWLSFE